MINLHVGTKASLSIVLAALLTASTLAMPPLQQLFAAEAATETDSNTENSQLCDEVIHTKTHEKARDLDKKQAKDLAENTEDFKTKTSGYSSEFESIFNTWSFDTKCNITWESVNVVYLVKDADGNAIKKVVITETPDLKKVKGSSEQKDLVVQAPPDSTVYDRYHSGYEVWKESGGNEVPIYEGKATNTVPGVQQPSSGCQAIHCDISSWVGLKSHVSDALVQAGSNSGIACFGLCSTSYYLWYEFLPEFATTCSNPVSPGDSVTTTITNEKKIGLGTFDYDITVRDNTKATACTVSRGYTNMGPDPIFAQFIDERPIILPIQGHARLPDFTPISWSSATYWPSGSTSSHSISESWTAGTWRDIFMRNPQGSGGTLNIAKSGLSGTSNSWTSTYITSAGDPPININALDQSGNSISGMSVRVYDAGNNLLGSGYTPTTVNVADSGTYYVEFDNYGSNHFTSAGDYPIVTSYTVPSWGGRATISVQDVAVTVNGYYATNTGSSNNLKVTSASTSNNPLTGMYMQLQNSAHTQINAGWTPVTFGSLGSGTYYVYANDYCNPTTHENRTFSRWGDGTTARGDTVNLLYDSWIKAYYNVGTC